MEHDLVDEYETVCDDYKRLGDRRKELIKQLEALNRPVVTGSRGQKYKRRSMRNVVPERLQEAVSVSLWTSITKRVPVAALVKAAVVRGKLTDELVDSCRTESEIWFAPTR